MPAENEIWWVECFFPPTKKWVVVCTAHTKEDAEKYLSVCKTVNPKEKYRCKSGSK
jgi:hypothetical protein